MVWWPFKRRKPDQPAQAQLVPTGLWRPAGERSLEDSEAVFGAVTLLANTLASMPLRLMQDGQEKADSDLARLVGYQPNPRMDAFTFWQTMEACRNTCGNCYALKVPAPGGGVAALEVLDPARVTPMMDQDTGDIWYQVRPVDGREWLISSREMLHCRHVATGSNVGVSPMRVLQGSLDYHATMQEFSLARARGVSGAVILDFPTTMGDEQVKRVIDNFLENYRRSSNSVIVLTGGVKSTVMNRSPVDDKALDVDRITGNKVARVYNLSPSLLGDYSQTRYASQEQEQRSFLDRTMLPIVRMYEAQCNLKLLTWQEYKSGLRWRFDLSELLAGDQKSRGELWQVLLRGGAIKVNEVRQREGLPPVPEGDVLLCSRDLVPLTALSKEEG